MPDYVDWFVNREKQFQGFLKMLARETPKTIMLIEAPGDMGKSWLIHKMRHYCLENQIATAHVDFRDRHPYDYLSLVRLARDQMGPLAFNQLTQIINSFTSVNLTLATGGTGSSAVNIDSNTGAKTDIGGDVAGRDIIKDNQFFVQADSDMARRTAEIRINDTFFQCLGQLVATQGRAVLLFDSYEDITTEADAWLCDYVLGHLRNNQPANTLLIVAGRKTPDLPADYKDLVARTGLDLFGPDHVKEYIEDRRKITGLDLQTLFKTSGGQPGLLAKMADVATMDTKSNDDWL
jgi:hypothetical protein